MLARQQGLCRQGRRASVKAIRSRVARVGSGLPRPTAVARLTDQLCVDAAPNEAARKGQQLDPGLPDQKGCADPKSTDDVAPSLSMLR
jgi:hypothetical protein